MHVYSTAAGFDGPKFVSHTLAPWQFAETLANRRQYNDGRSFLIGGILLWPTAVQSMLRAPRNVSFVQKQSFVSSQIGFRVIVDFRAWVHLSRCICDELAHNVRCFRCDSDSCERGYLIDLMRLWNAVRIHWLEVFA